MSAKPYVVGVSELAVFKKMTKVHIITHFLVYFVYK